jgi:hypothetical protein
MNTPNRLHFATSITAISTCIALAGCANPTSVRWNKADDYTGRPVRVLLVSDVGAEFGDDFASGFSRQFKTLASGCGSELDVVRIPAGDRSRVEDSPRVRSYGPDALLSVRRSGGTRHASGDLFHVTYDVRLIDMSQRKTVWRASADFYRGAPVTPAGDRGTVLANDLVSQMVEAVIWKDCGPKRSA